MSLRTAALLAGMLAGGFVVHPAGLAAQQDTGMMMHDSAMSNHGQMMKHDSAMAEHGQMMGHDSAMGPNMAFVGNGRTKATGDYEVSGPEGKRQLKLTEDFSVEAAPDLYLVLATGPAPGKDALFLSELKQADGSQSYDLPTKAEDSKYTTLLVWSKKEKRAVASAEWHPATGGMMQHM